MAKKTKKPQARQRGSIQKRGEGKFLVRVYRGTDPSGKRQYTSKTVTGSLRDAQEALTALQREVDENAFVEPSKVSLAQLCEHWLDNKKDIRETTRGLYQDRLNKWVYPHLGGTRISALTALDVDRLYTTLLNQGLAGSSVRAVHNVLRQALDQGVRWGYLKASPAASVELPRAEDREPTILTPEQIRRLLSATRGTRLYALWVTLLTTGVRPGEALALKWSDIEEDHIVIQRTLVYEDNHNAPIINKPKTRKGTRRVSIPAATKAALVEHRRQQLDRAFTGRMGNLKGGWVFLTRYGNLYRRRAVVTEWKSALRLAGLPTDVRLYDTRHSHATALLSSGENVKVISERLGHANIQITLDTYTHVLPEAERGAADKVGEMFFEGSERRLKAV